MIAAIFKIVSVFVPALIVFSCGEKIESTWKTNQILIDGRGNEWSEYPLQFNEDLNIVYGIVNNDSLLYCMIRFGDRNLARLISIRGFTLWANNSDDEEKMLGIHYRDARSHEDVNPMMRSRPRQLNQSENNDMKVLDPGGRFSLAQNDSISDHSINNIYGMNAAAGYDKGLYCFEFSITLKSFPEVIHYLGAEPGKVIKVGLEIAGLSEKEQERLKEEMEERLESMGRGRSARTPPGGMIGGMMGGGGRGMRGGGLQMPDLDGEEFWITINLAKSGV